MSDRVVPGIPGVLGRVDPGAAAVVAQVGGFSPGPSTTGDAFSSPPGAGRVLDLRRTEAPAVGPLSATRSPVLRMYGIAVLDSTGRVSDRALFGVLRWQPGTRVEIGVDGAHRVVVAARRSGGSLVNPKGMVLLPARVRRWCGLRARERVLLVAVPSMSAMVICGVEALDGVVPNPRAVVDAMRPLGQHGPVPGMDGGGW